jgi:hypothetical protein
VPGKYNPLDPPDDFFRIRLVTTMLETCGMFFNRGAAGKKLDYFLSFFQVRAQLSISHISMNNLGDSIISISNHPYPWMSSLASTIRSL